MNLKHIAFLTVFCLFISTCVSQAAEQWKPVQGKIMTEFAAQVDSVNPHPEYPRPQLLRNDWKNLNGLWDYAIVGENDDQPNSFDEKILVPFAIESALSGVGKTVGPDTRLWYKRTFEVPADWKSKRIILHFGAVDWDSVVYVNGKKLGQHKGGYSPFSYDITDSLTESGEQTLVVSVWDPTDLRGGTQPRGKQHSRPNGIWYTAVTGIWQTVWIEPVDQTHITKIKAVPNTATETVSFTVNAVGAKNGDKIEIRQLSREERQVVRNKRLDQERRQPLTDRRPRNLGGTGTGRGAGGQMRMETATAIVEADKATEFTNVKIENPRHWTPDTPVLYDVRVSIIRDGKTIDSVDSYFAMRDVKLAKDDQGITRIMLNGKFLFQHGPLDQGWWPDGLYTAPTDKALEYDVVRTKDFGYNTLRKHVKVEPDRFYFHCDRLGMLVWQDMPSGDRYIGGNDPDIVRTEASDKQFRAELKEMVYSLDNHPSIIIWVPFNEGWGQYNTAGITNYVRELDPTRLVNSVSGWADRGVGDMYDMHNYPGPGMFPAEEKRASVLGEYGGLGMPIEGHLWQTDRNWGYVSFEEKDALFNRYAQLNRAMHPLIAKGLSAAIYTQTTDVEGEVNGLMTYDRKVDKFDAAKFKASNDKLHYPAPTTEMLIPTAREKASMWKWSTEKPTDGWEQVGFDDSSWKEGESGFGTPGTPNVTVRTRWNSGDIWVRKTFEVSQETAKDSSQLALNLYHDEDCEVYINGKLVFSAKGYVSNYTNVEMDQAALKEVLKSGTNTIAIHCKQTTGGQYIDAGFNRIVPPKNADEKIW